MNNKTTGFASPSQGYEEQNIDLNRLLIHNPLPPTFFDLKQGICPLLGAQRLFADSRPLHNPRVRRHGA
jgi:hypothetical protein